jgi:hypothetical protein
MKLGRHWYPGRSAVVGSVLLVALAVLTACGRNGGPVTNRSYAPADLVLRVQTIGGFVPAALLLTELPVVSVYGDGRVITGGATPAIYPGPALPVIQVRHISTDAVNRLVQRALDAGVGRDVDLGTPQVADAPSTRFTVLDAPAAGTPASGTRGPSVSGTPGTAGARVRTTEVTALGIDDGAGLTGVQRQARQGLQALSDALTDLPTTLGPGAIDQPGPFVATAVAVVASPWTDSGTPQLPAPPERSWPGPELPGPPAPNGGSLSCLAVTGDQAGAVLTAAAQANAATPWTSAGFRWTVQFRPLLPDEPDCTSLGR